MSGESSKLIIDTAEVFEPLLYPTRYKGAHGGRGSGKSHFFAEMLVDDHYRIPGLRSVCIREVQRSLEQSAKRLIEDKIATLDLPGFEVQREKILTPCGGLIIFQGMQNHTADSIKSLEGFRRAWVEEAQSLSQRSLDLLRPTIRSEDSELWFSWNPDNATDPVDVFLRHNPPPGAVVVEANHTHNPWFPEILRHEMEWDRTRDFDKYEHVWMGQYAKSSEARVFKHWRVDEFTTPEDAQFYHGADWGFSQDPTVLVRAFIQDTRLFIDGEAYGIGVDIDKTPALFDAVPTARKWRIIADSARPETISYMKRQGYDITGAKKGKGSVEDGVEFIKSFEEVVIHPRCKHTIDEFKMYAYKTDRLTGEPIPQLEDKHNHCLVGNTVIMTQAGPELLNGISAGRLVYTSEGIDVSTGAVMTRRDAKIYRVKLKTGEFVDGTHDHKMLTMRGWCSIDTLRYDDVLFSVRSNTWLNRKLLNIAGYRIAGGLNRKGEPIEFTTEPRQANGYTSLFMRMLSGLCQMVIMYTTRTATLSTIALTTLKRFLRRITYTLIRGVKSVLNLNSYFLPALDQLLRSGIRPQRVGRGILRMGKEHGLIESSRQERVSIAAENTKHGQLTAETAFVPISARRLIDANQALTTKSEYAHNARQSSGLIGIASKIVVAAPVLTVTEQGTADVYDMNVGDAHNFIANGVIVHNCLDSLRYGLEPVMKAHKSASVSNHSAAQVGL